MFIREGKERLMVGSCFVGGRKRRYLLFGLWLMILILVLLLPMTTATGHPPERQAPLAVQPTLAIEPFATGFDLPVGIVSAGDDRLFIVERRGKLRILQPDGAILEPPFLDITHQVRAIDQEQGLLGLVFAPNDPNTFYISYINLAEELTLARYRVDATNPNRADSTSGQPIFSLKKPYTNHNAGALAFGPDGNLYFPLGDGGGGGDPDDRAQNLSQYFGKILRINVTGVPTYTIPGDNPFALDNDPATLAEIWAVGVRNPWRLTLDRATDNIFFGDVGEGNWEEVNFLPITSTGGLNYGWDCYEGSTPFASAGCGNATLYVKPIYEYPHTGVCTSVTGGYVYRGARFPNLQGHYLFADFCHGTFGSLLPDGQGGWTPITHTVTINQPATFGQDRTGELYVAAVFDGIIYKILDTSVQPTRDPRATPTPTKTPWPSPTPTWTPAITPALLPTVTPTKPAPTRSLYLPLVER